MSVRTAKRRVRREVYIDRSKSGDATFWPAFAARHAAPLALRNGSVKLRILVDTASVTVFAGENEVTLTDQIFPSLGSDAASVFAEDGDASLIQMKIWELKPIWTNR